MATHRLQIDGPSSCLPTDDVGRDALQASVEEFMQVRAAITDMRGKLNLRKWEFSPVGNLQTVWLVEWPFATVVVAVAGRDACGRSGLRVSWPKLLDRYVLHGLRPAHGRHDEACASHRRECPC